VYVVDTDSIASYSRNASSGGVALLQTQTSANGLDGAVGIATSPDGKQVYVTGHRKDALTRFTRDPATGELTWPRVHEDGGIGLDGLDGAVGVALDSDGDNVYVAGYDDDAVVVFGRSASDGNLSPLQVITGTGGLDGARSIAVSPDGGRVYVASTGDDSLSIFDRNAMDGTLTYRGMVQDTAPGVDGLWDAYAVVVSPDGNHVYVASYSDDAVSHFDYHADGLIYQSDDLWKDGAGLALYLNGANDLAISPDGKFVYVASRWDDSVTVFARLPVSGNLSWVADYVDDVGGVDGLNGARSVTVSADGKRVYVASQHDHALAVFDRDETFGLLQFVGVYKDGQDGVDGLNVANGVAVSPDGGHVYVTGYGDDAVAVFAKFRVYLPLVLRD
jgi:DNA-binding beta-propeller fold protein YncE